MEKTELIELSKKLGMNQKAVLNYLETNPQAAEEQITKAAKFMRLIE